MFNKKLILQLNSLLNLQFYCFV